jgi:carboxyl-terminal processing protease
MHRNKIFVFLAGSLVCAASLVGRATAQQAQPPQITVTDRGWTQDMLQTVADEIRKNYYDPKLHGVDFDAAVARAKQKIDKAESVDMAMSYIAGMVSTLNDSHTHFYPPGRYHGYDYGIEYQIIGERCYITQVRPGRDAEKKGMKPGDEILAINGFFPDRKNISDMLFIFGVLRPQPSVRLLLQKPVTGESHEVEVNAKLRLAKRASYTAHWMQYYDEAAHYFRPRMAELSGGVVVLKFPNFYFSNSEIAGMLGKAQKGGTLILDLRGNSGGASETLKGFVGALFDREVKIDDRVTRKKTEAEVVKGRNKFSGKLIVLVDAESASAAEILARVVQLEKRGTVIGDRTSGMVMESIYHHNDYGHFGVSITDADLIMTDGKSLEHVGVKPDELMIPSATDLASGRDPVLAHAAELAGAKLTPEAAGQLFPYEWWPPDPE